MPRTNTRRRRAIDLLNRLERGPSFHTTGSEPFTPNRAAGFYRLWSRSWVLEELKNLVPELKVLTTEAHGEICKTDPCELCRYGYRAAPDAADALLARLRRRKSL